MRLLPSDPDVETIISRIEAGDLNLQPDFQRGEVWSKGKKQRLVDSILRDWHVPPIHVIENVQTRQQEVLDGQQRLVAIRDFYRNEFPVDGSIEPKDARIIELNGLRYSELPPDARRQFNQFTIRVFRIVDHKGSEPAELFFRLNQPTNLTSAEQRNAYFGPVRQQIRHLVDELGEMGLDKGFLGFSNSRMAYDDVLSRAALCIARNSIAEKITSIDLVELYRSDVPLSGRTENSLRLALKTLGQARGLQKDHPRFNKATFFSWIMVLVRSQNSLFHEAIEARELAGLLSYVEHLRQATSLGFAITDPSEKIGNLPIQWLLNIYEDRSTSRVADVSSVVLRDVTCWLLRYQFRCLAFPSVHNELPERLGSILDDVKTTDADLFARAAISAGWGELL